MSKKLKKGRARRAKVRALLRFGRTLGIGVKTLNAAHDLTSSHKDPDVRRKAQQLMREFEQAARDFVRTEASFAGLSNFS